MLERLSFPLKSCPALLVLLLCAGATERVVTTSAVCVPCLSCMSRHSMPGGCYVQAYQLTGTQARFVSTARPVTCASRTMCCKHVCLPSCHQQEVQQNRYGCGVRVRGPLIRECKWQGALLSIMLTGPEADVIFTSQSPT